VGDPGRTVSENAPQPARQFGWSDMFVRPEDDPRSDTGFDGERATLVGFLRDQRLTLELKCAGLFRSDDDRDLDFNGAVPDPAVVAEAWDAWRAEVAFAEQYVDDAPDVERVGRDGHDLRTVLVHMIEEYARHNGHADLLRERIDGRVGQ